MNYLKTNQLVKSKKISNSILLVISLFMYATLFSQEASNQKVGIFDFETEEIDYGTINENANGLRTFKFMNVGTAPIIIADTKTSCGCTVPKLSKNIILSGETAEIDIKYETSRIGAFSKTITVISNAYETKKLLKIKGIVVKKKTMK